MLLGPLPGSHPGAAPRLLRKAFDDHVRNGLSVEPKAQIAVVLVVWHIIPGICLLTRLWLWQPIDHANDLYCLRSFAKGRIGFPEKARFREIGASIARIVLIGGMLKPKRCRIFFRDLSGNLRRPIRGFLGVGKMPLHVQQCRCIGKG